MVRIQLGLEDLGSLVQDFLDQLQNDDVLDDYHGVFPRAVHINIGWVEAADGPARVKLESISVLLPD